MPPIISFPIVSGRRFITNKSTMRMSLFSDNSLVYYKPGSLASGGVGSVKNQRHKWKNT